MSYSSIIPEFDTFTRVDGFDVFCGPLLGEGIHRRVFQSYLDPQWVIKLAINTSGVLANVEEWQTWNDLNDMPHIQRWFAKCKAMSQHNTVLIQRYSPDLPVGKYRIPSYLTDTKRENYGLDGTQVVCRDYGLHNLRVTGIAASRPLKSKLWVVAD
jgi:hypothetical protein